MQQENTLISPDADDCMVPNAIESLIEKFEKYSCDMIVFGYKMIFSDGTERKFNDYPNKKFLPGVM